MKYLPRKKSLRGDTSPKGKSLQWKLMVGKGALNNQTYKMDMIFNNKKGAKKPNPKDDYKSFLKPT